MLFPALAWLVVQFSMSGIVYGTPAGAMQIEICSAYGAQQIDVDAGSGQPPQPGADSGCDWCHHFGATADLAARDALPWVVLARDFSRLVPPPSRLHQPLRLVADFQSRAPPYL
jgi:hypothetical protein